MRKLKKIMRKLFSSKLQGQAWIPYAKSIEGEKKGADIWGTDYPVPTSDILHYRLLEQEGGSSQYVITSITSKIFFFIPFTYDEYIIEIPWHKYELTLFNANKALKEINAAEHWNQRDEMKPCGFSGDVTFDNGIYQSTYKVNGSDYTWLVRNGK